jgi:hypothetical protein
MIDNDHSRVGRWMYSKGAGQWREGSTCIGLTHNGELVAGVMYDYFNGASVFANIAITGRVTRTWLWYICAYPFNQLKCQVVIALVAGDNLKSQRFVTRFGFQPVAIIPQADPCGSMGIYALYRSQCRFLGGPHGQT